MKVTASAVQLVRNRIRRPRTRKGWLITSVVVAASVAVKLILGAGVILFIVHALSP